VSDVPRLMIPAPASWTRPSRKSSAARYGRHYGEPWVRGLRQLHDDLATLLGAARTYLLPGSGSAGLDAALFSMFEPGHRVVVVDPVTSAQGSPPWPACTAWRCRTARVSQAVRSTPAGWPSCCLAATVCW